MKNVIALAAMAVLASCSSNKPNQDSEPPFTAVRASDVGFYGNETFYRVPVLSSTPYAAGSLSEKDYVKGFQWGYVDGLVPRVF